MFLENMVKLGTLKKGPQKMVFLAAAFVLIGFLTAFVIFRRETSIVMLFFSSMLFLPYMIRMLKQEKMGGKSGGLRSVFRRHKVFMEFYIFVFVGMALEYFLLFSLLPPAAGNVAFKNQLNTIIPGAGGAFVNARISLFNEILVNNLVIVFVAIILSIFYEVGALFILNYNASIAGALYGSALRPLIWGMDGIAIPLYLPPLALVPHTVIEILGYIFAAIAGGILARSFSRPGKNIGLDFFLFSMVAVVLIVVGAAVEIIVPFAFLS